MIHYKTKSSELTPSTMRPAQAAAYVGVSPSKLAKLRLIHNRRDGPAFIKLSGCILYRKSDLDTWLDQHTVKCGG